MVDDEARSAFEVVGHVDAYESWRTGARAKLDAGLDRAGVEVELEIGARLLDGVARRGGPAIVTAAAARLRGGDPTVLDDAVAVVETGSPRGCGRNVNVPTAATSCPRVRVAGACHSSAHPGNVIDERSRLAHRNSQRVGYRRNTDDLHTQRCRQ